MKPDISDATHRQVRIPDLIKTKHVLAGNVTAHVLKARGPSTWTAPQKCLLFRVQMSELQMAGISQADRMHKSLLEQGNRI